MKITNHDYHHAPEHAGLSSTALRRLAISPANYLDYISRPHEPASKEMIFGSAAHTLILEPDRWAIEVQVKKTVAKAARDEASAAGFYLIDQSEADAIHRMRDNLMRKEIAKLLFDGAIFEESIFWHELHDTRCKCRPDLRNEKYKVISDLKTAVSGEKRLFRFDAFKFKYALQGEFYQRGVEQHYGEHYDFVFTVCEKQPPYDAAFYLLDDEFCEASGVYPTTIQQLLEVLHKAETSGVWSGYPDEVVKLSF